MLIAGEAQVRLHLDKIGQNSIRGKASTGARQTWLKAGAIPSFVTSKSLYNLSPASGFQNENLAHGTSVGTCDVMHVTGVAHRST